MAAGTTLMRWPDAAPLLGVDTRVVLDLIVVGDIEPVRRLDDLYVRRDQVDTLQARSFTVMWSAPLGVGETAVRADARGAAPRSGIVGVPSTRGGPPERTERALISGFVWWRGGI